jgi:hypothetical protein
MKVTVSLCAFTPGAWWLRIVDLTKIAPYLFLAATNAGAQNSLIVACSKICASRP